MTNDGAGVWSATLGPIESDLYGYGFLVDGLRTLDPANVRMKPMRANQTSILDVPGQKPSPCDWSAEVTHGAVHLHDYASKAAGSLRRLRVYTPAGYGRSRLPVLYLFHGFGDNEATWTELGRAHLILDNLIAAKKAKPMVVVMTDGHPVAPGSPESRASNLNAFEKDLLENVIPLVEANYKVSERSSDRAIVGLSMGGQQSMVIGLRHPELFAWVGGMSTGVREVEQTFGDITKDPKPINKSLKLCWFACGVDDQLIGPNRKMHEIFNERHIKHEFVETSGNHSWPVWRRYLADFAPRLFK